jgi:hypothetical protein
VSERETGGATVSDTTWFNGDEVKYSGETTELYGGVFYVTHRVSDGKEVLVTTAPALTPPEPCGYCRRCAVHDDPGGCLTVEAWAREHDPEGKLEVPYEYESDETTGLAGHPDGPAERW